MNPRSGNDVRILSFQPYSVYAPGGSSRILRRMFESREAQVQSLVVAVDTSKHLKGEIKETVVPVVTPQRSWMKWHLRTVNTWLNESPFRQITIKRLQKVAARVDCNVVHVINQGKYSAALCNSSILRGKELWVSFHDHYAVVKSSYADAETLWKIAHRRLVISKKMGEHYSQIFGANDYEILTDGLRDDEVADHSIYPFEIEMAQPVTIYFAGLLHVDYYCLFQTLADALDSLSVQGYTFNLLLRGAHKLRFLDNRSFITKYLPFTLNGAELKKELWNAQLLYLPIKFSPVEFYLYSLSTKMIGYLGAPGSILYHGAKESAACQLLEQYNSSVNCISLAKEDMERVLLSFLKNRPPMSQNAKRLAREKFQLSRLQQQFWQTNK